MCDTHASCWIYNLRSGWISSHSFWLFLANACKHLMTRLPTSSDQLWHFRLSCASCGRARNFFFFGRWSLKNLTRLCFANLIYPWLLLILSLFDNQKKNKINYTNYNKAISWLFATTVSRVAKDSKIIATTKPKRV